MQEKSQTGKDQQLENPSPGTSAETGQIPESDTSPVKTMTVLQSARPRTNTDEPTSQSVERVPPEVVQPEGSFGSSGDTDVNIYCEDKFRSLSDDEI